LNALDSLNIKSPGQMRRPTCHKIASNLCSTAPVECAPSSSSGTGGAFQIA
jgi:hypothetical protein